MKTAKKVLSMLLISLMLLTSVPLQGFAGINLPDWLTFEAKADEKGLFDDLLNSDFELPQEFENDRINFEIDEEKIRKDLKDAMSVFPFEKEDNSDTEFMSPQLFMSDGNATEDSFEWSYDEATKTLTISGSGDMPDYSAVSGDVPAVNTPWFSFASEIEKVVIEDGITSVGAFSFALCTNLKEVILPEGITSIGNGAFYICINLNSISFPSTLLSVGEMAFGMCWSVKELVLPDSIETIEDTAFAYMLDVERINIPKNIQHISQNAFVYLMSLEEVTVPDGVPPVNYDLFNDMYTYSIALRRIVNNSSVAVLTQSVPVVFDSIEYAQAYVYFHKNVFKYEMFSELPGVNISEAAITEDVINYLNNKIGTDYRSEDYAAFEDLSEDVMNHLYIHVIDEEGVSSPSYFSVSCIDDSLQHDYCKTNVIKHTIIGESDLCVCFDMSGICGDNITWTVDGETKTLILDGSGTLDPGEYSEYRHFSEYIHNIEFSETSAITAIGDGAFSGLINVSEITLPEGIEALGEGCFYNSGVRILNLPASLISADDLSFYTGSAPLEEINVAEGNDEFVSYEGSLYSKYVEYEGEMTYLLLKQPEKHAGVFIDNTIGLYCCAFENYSTVTEITVPDTVLVMTEAAFYNCTSLETINIGNSKIYEADGETASLEIDERFVAYCYNLTAINVDERNVNYSSVDGVLYNKNVTEIITVPMGLSEVTVPGTVTAIPRYAFDYNKLQKVTFLNPDCEIESSSFVYINESATICGYKDSTAEAYADEYDRNFEYIGDVTVTNVEFDFAEAKKVYCEFASLDTTGIKVTLYFSDGTTSVKTSGFSISGFNGYETGEQVLTVNYREYSDTYIVRVGLHNYYVSSSEDASCTEKGYITYVCSECGDSFTESVNPSGHKDETADDVCDVCGAEILYISVDETKSITVGEGETVFVKFVPVTSGQYKFYSSATSDTYAYLYDADMNELTHDDDGGEGENFTITYDLEADVVYYWAVRYYSSSSSGSFDVTLECAHSGEWEVVTDPTCTSVGSKTCVCVYCGKTVTEEISVLSHNYELTETVPATCTEYGYERYDCTGCDEYYTNEIHSLGHDYIYTTTKEATCTETGVESVTCGRCDYTDENTIAKTMHTDDNSDAVCDVCEAAILYISVDETKSITVGEGETVFVKFVPVTSGRYKFYSSATSDTYAYLYDADMNELTSDDDGGEGGNFTITYDLEADVVYYWAVRYYSSSSSGSFDVTLECVHSGEWEVVTDPTCTSVGSKTCVCVQCGKTVTEEIPTLSHNYELTENIPATCTEYGYERYDCTGCDEYYTNEIHSLGHDYIYTTTKEPSCTEKGEQIRSCTRCGVEETVILNTAHVDEDDNGICELCGGNASDIFAGETKLIDVAAGEITYLSFLPEYSGKYTFYSSSDSDTYGYLYDENKNQLTHDDDGGENNNFTITYTLEKRKLYYWGARYYSSSKSGSFEVTLDFECPHPDTDRDGICDNCGESSIIATGACGENLTWTIYGDALVITGEGEMDNYSGSSSPWYSYRDYIHAVEIDNGVTSIESHAFYDCDSLTSVIIPDSVTSIGNYAFAYCDSLTSITIPDSVTSIGSYAFFNCDSLTSITIPDSVTSIGSYAFRDCDSLTSITIPDSVTSIGSYAFFNCDSLTSITVDDNNPYYSSDEFGVLFNKNKTELIQFPAGSSEISYNIPDSVTSIGDVAFVYCDSLTSITIPDSVTYIGYGAFFNCDSLTSITFRNPETRIYDSSDTISTATVIHGYEGSTAQAYAEKYGREFVALVCEHINTTEHEETPADCINDGATAGVYCEDCNNWISGHEVIEATGHTDADDNGICDTCGYDGIVASGVCGDNLTWKLTDKGTLVIEGTGEMYNYSGSSSPWYSYRAYIYAVDIVDGVTSIGSCAFEYCTSLTEITIPDSVTSIGSYAFRDCDSLTNITIPDSVTSIGYSAFRDCDSLTSITIPDSVTSIGSFAFSDCDNLTSITIPDSVTSIGSFAFAYCTSLTSITIPDSVTSIGGSAFEYCTGLTSITIPDSVTSIGYSAFYNCDSLTSITFHNPETQIYDSSDTISTATVIHGYEGSTAQAYAEKYGREFVVYVCEHINTTEHEETPADCINDGATAGVYCEDCNNWISGHEVIEATGHSYVSIITVPTCTVNGYTTHTCSACNDTYTDSEVEAPGHTVDELTEDVPPTCVEEGYTKGICSACGEEVVNSVAATGHTFSGEWEIIQELSCVTDEIKVKSCDVCGEKSAAFGVTAEDFPKCIGADYTHNMNTTFDSYSVPGADRIVLHFSADSYLESGCDRIYVYAGDSAVEENLVGSYTGSLSDTIVNVDASSFTIRMTTDGSVSNYGFEISSIDYYMTDAVEITDAPGHSYGDWETVTEATCTTSGVKERVCAACGSEETETISSFGHSYGDWVVKTEATCTASGLKEKTCSTCGNVTTSTISSLGHDYIYTTTKEATCTQTGVETVTCSRCDYVKENIIAKTMHTDENNDFICESCEGEIPHIAIGETQNITVNAGETVYIKYVPSVSGKHKFYSSATSDTYAYLYDADMNELTHDDDGGENNNFTITYDLEADVVYYWAVRYYSSSDSGSFDVTLECVHTGEWEVITEPTCTSVGSQTCVCTQCGETVTKEIPKISHNYELSETVSATCTENGYERYDCTGCDEYYTNTLYSTGHNYIYISTEEATCTENGSDKYVCEYCDDEYVKAFSPRHRDSDSDGFCDFCNEPYVGVLDLVFVIDSTGSMGDEVSVVKNSIQSYANQLAESNIPYYISLIDFSNDSSNNGKFNYYHINFDFTNDNSEILSGISGLSLKGGGDEPAYSALINGLDELHWGDGSVKRVILIGDETPWVEPSSTTGFDYDDALNSLTEREVVLYSVATGGTDISIFESLATATNGSYYRSSTSSDFSQVLTDIIDSIPESLHIHTYEESYTEATCTAGGLTTYHCTGCGKDISTETEALGHDYSEEWTVDKEATCTENGSKSHHCSRCEDKADVTVIEATGHSYVSIVTVPTCTVNGYTTHTCSVCNDTYTDSEVDALGHAYGEWDVTTEPTCTNTGVEERTCERCSAVETQTVEALGHDYSEEWTVDKEATCTEDGSKSHHCSRCEDKADVTVIEKLGHSYGEWDVVTAPTCTKTGVEKHTCERCSAVETQTVEALGHDYSEEWTVDKEATCTEDGSKSHHCSRCEDKTDVTVIEKLGHDWSEWQITTEPTCIKTGIEERTCERCSAVESQTVEALGHDYSEEWTIDKEATCTEDGSKSHHCSRCEDKTDVTVIEKLGHDWSEWQITTEPTCIKTGVEERTCERCSAVETQTVEALGHDYSEEWTVDKEATCTEDGSKSHHCSRCEDKADVTVIEKLGHSYGEWEVVTAPTCTKTGVEERTCERCSAVETQTVEALGHDYSAEWTVDKEATCTENGSKSHHCLHCEDKADITTIEATGHSYVSIITVPTCTVNGYTTHTCSVCKDTYTDSEVEALGHAYGEWVVTTKPTCTTAGVEKHTCEKCGATETQTVEALGHSYGEWITEKESTVLSEGLKSRTCSRCSNTEEEITEKIYINIEENTEYGLANFNVVNAQTLEPIEGASIFIATENDGENTFFTDAEGKVSIILPVGKQTVSAYSKDYLTRNLSINVKSGENNIPAIGLSNLNTYDVEIKHELMTDEEIEEAGIDTSDPANQHVYRYELQLNFTPEIDYESIFAYFNADGNCIGGYYGPRIETDNTGGESGPILHYHVTTDGWTHGWCEFVDVAIGDTVSLTYMPWRDNTDEYVFDGWYSDSSFNNKIYSVEIEEKYTEVYGRWIYIGEEEEEDNKGSVRGIKVDDEITVYPVSENFYLIIRGEVKWLKEMFDVEMLVINNSMTDTLEQLEGTLVLPDGLSLAAMNGEEQSLTQQIENVAEGEAKSVHWYVRGDKEGSYSIEALLDGMVMPFEEEIHDKFVAKDKLQVLAGSALNLHFEFPDTAYYGEDYPITITLTNVSDRTLYNVNHMIQVVQGMEIYYSDGSVKKKIEPSAWESIGVDRFKPGDKLIIETSVNIFFESEIMEMQLNKLIGIVDNIETLLNGYKAIKDIFKLFDKTSSSISKVNKALSFKDSVLSSIESDKKAATKKLYDSLSSLYSKYVDFDNKSVNKGVDLINYGIGEVLEFMASDNALEYISKQKASDIEKLAKKVGAFAESFEVTEKDIADFDLFDSIRTMISAIPIKYALTSVVMTEDENNTTSIPWSYTVTDAGPQYFGVTNVSSYLYDIVMVAAAEAWEEGTADAGLLNLIPGFDDPFNVDEIKRRIIATEKEIERFQAKDSTGEITFNAYYVENTKMRSAANNYMLSCDNDNAVFENGILTFTGEGNIAFTPLNTNGGTLYIEDSEGNTYTYEIDVVEQHECKACDEQRIIMNPTYQTNGVAVKCCETCEDIMEIINLESFDCEEHSFGEWEHKTEVSCTADGILNRVCLTCGYTETDFIDATGHTEITINKADASCTESGYTGDVVCEVCGETITVGEVIDASGHDYVAIVTVPTCTKGGYTTNTCSVCKDSYITDETEMLSHSGGTADCADKAICAVCGEAYGETDPENHKSIVTDKAVEATCTSTGLTEGSHCDACGEVIVAQTVTEKLSHTEETIPAVEATCSKTGLTEGTKCSVCGEILVEQEETEKLGHSGGTADCVDKATCTVCGEAYGETDPENHKSIVTDKAVEATCTSTGLTEGSHCDACGEVIVAQTTVDKIAHTEETIPAVEATCSKTGLTEGTKCSVCGEILVEQEETEKLSHSYNTAVTAPTCTTGGYTTYTCSVCNDTYKADEKAKLGHSMGSFVVEKYPDCTESGIEYAECSRCDYSETRDIPATGHSFENGTCTECGESQSINCSHLCHKTGFLGFIWKVINFFNKLFKINQICSCGGYHW